MARNGGTPAAVAISMDRAFDFEQIVFSGGGVRCFWQGGFMSVLRQVRRSDPARVTGVSGGALAASSWLAGCERTLVENMTSAFDAAESNVNWNQFEADGLTPHQRIYREVVRETLGGAASEAIAGGPVFQILIAHPPTARFGRLTGTLAAIAYEAEQKLRSSPRYRWPKRLGVTMSRVDARQAAREGRLVDLVCAAAVIPPLFELARWNGRPVIDGGVFDQAPMPEPNGGETLVLLTRRYRNLPQAASRHYVVPSEETDADKVDFTDPEKVKRTWRQGEDDARGYLDRGWHPTGREET